MGGMGPPMGGPPGMNGGMDNDMGPMLDEFGHPMGPGGPGMGPGGPMDGHPMGPGGPGMGPGPDGFFDPSDKSGNSTKKNGLANKQLNGTNQRLDDPSNPKFNTTTGQTVELGKPAREFPPTEEENLSTNQPSPGVVTTTT